MDKELMGKLRYLRMPGLLSHWDEYIEMAERESFSPVRLLRHVLEEEFKVKQDNAYRQRLKRAKIPEPYVIQTFPFHRQPNLDRQKVMSVYDNFDYVEKSRNIIWVGPTGAGKTGLATSFLIQAIERGYRGRYVKFSDLANELYASVADRSTDKVIKRYLRYDCLLIDEMTYIPLEAVQIGYVFTLIDKRYKKSSTLITSNLGFSEWSSFLKCERLTSALLDRITDSSYVINMKSCVSLRPKLKDVSELLPKEQTPAEGEEETAS